MITLTTIRRVHLVGPRGSKKPINIAARTLKVLAWIPDLKDPDIPKLNAIMRVLKKQRP